MGDAILCQRIEQRARHMVLANDVRKELRPIFAGKNLVGGHPM
jgi:hypothetical protein